MLPDDVIVPDEPAIEPAIAPADSTAEVDTNTPETDNAEH
jgi:hypothetical protein